MNGIFTEEAARLHRMLDTGEGVHPDMVHVLSDIMTQMVHHGRAGELEEMVEKYAALYPEEYGKEYDWLFCPKGMASVGRIPQDLGRASYGILPDHHGRRS
jgi:hypothetical protein